MRLRRKVETLETKIRELEAEIEGLRLARESMEVDLLDLAAMHGLLGDATGPKAPRHP